MRIPREDFLRRTLKEHCTSAEIDAAAATTPAQAGLSPALIEKLAKQAVRSESTRVSAFSAATGLPGGFALLGMVPPDVAQNLAHVLRVSQKLAYLHGWPDFFDGDEFDETTKGILTLFSGVMFGAYGAIQGVTKISNLLANRVASEWPKRALSQGVLYPVVNRIATQLGLRMSKEAFARGGLQGGSGAGWPRQWWLHHGDVLADGESVAPSPGGAGVGPALTWTDLTRWCPGGSNHRDTTVECTQRMTAASPISASLDSSGWEGTTRARQPICPA